jgi:hypothetical protein
MAVPLVPILGLAGKLLDKMFPDPAERAAAEAKLQGLQMDGELKQVELQLSAIVMEAKSADPWTSRARPSFMYVVYIYLLTAIPFGMIFAFFPDRAGALAGGVSTFLSSIPGEMWTLFGAGYLGYTGARTLEKRKLVENTGSKF